MSSVSAKVDKASALSGKTMEELGMGDRVWRSRQKEASVPPSPKRRQPVKKPPVPVRFVQPMKARLLQRPPAGRWLYEIKFDGFRAVALVSGGEIRLLSQNEKDLGAKFPEIIDSLAQLPVADAILDGE